MEEKLQDETSAPQETTPQAVTEEIIETAPAANPAAQPKIPKEAEDIDLNTLYPDEDGDLNALFPEQEIKSLLKKIQKSKKDLRRIKDRFIDDKDLMP